MLQRLLDIVFSGMALILLAPLLALLIFILKFTGEGEVFFRQARVGKCGEPFSLLKFATMLRNSPNLGTGTVTLKDDPRILPFGKFLRRSKLNELPQLWNIFKGDMSLIGPRPQTLRCFDAFPAASQEAIVRVRPGLSGVGSIVFRGEEDLMLSSDDSDRFYDEIIMPYKGELEEWYVERAGVKLFLVCVALTIWVVLRPQSPIIWRVFPDLPSPPPELRKHLAYPGSGG
jgi:lipopolysaccharide/colanic/teichoic acid biosynthesis glycosyltransferase